MFWVFNTNLISMLRIIDYIKESFNEINKVAWPTRQQAIKSSIIVIVFLVISSIVFGGIDIILNKLYEYIIFNLT